MIDKSNTPPYTQVVYLGNGIEEAMPTMKGENNMGRQRVHVVLPSGEPVWITGDTFTDIIQNALNKYGVNDIQTSSEGFEDYTNKIFDIFLKPRWKESTAETNRFLLYKHILPFFRNYSLKEIDTAAIQSFFKSKQHLSKSYTKQMLIILHEIFQNAVEDKKVKEDPTRSKRITLPQKKTIRDGLDQADYYDIVQHIKDLSGEDALIMAILCFTGMRRGEMLGLKWKNVLDDKILIRSEITFSGNSPTFNDYTKSSSGIREIPIPKELKPYLKKRGKDNYFVIGEKQAYTQSKFNRAWQRIGKQINLYGATPHILRHTYLSMMAASNVDPKTIQALAGHADFSFTFNKYINRNSSNIQNAGEKLSEKLEELTKKLTKS